MDRDGTGGGAPLSNDSSISCVCCDISTATIVGTSVEYIKALTCKICVLSSTGAGGGGGIELVDGPGEVTDSVVFGRASDLRASGRVCGGGGSDLLVEPSDPLSS